MAMKLTETCTSAVNWLENTLPNKKLILMTDTGFLAAGYAILIEYDPNQNCTTVTKSYAPMAYEAKTFMPSQLKISLCANEF